MINKAQEHTILNNKNTQKVGEEINLFLQDIENRLGKIFLPAQKEIIAEELKTASFSSMFPVDVRKKIDALKKSVTYTKGYNAYSLQKGSYGYRFRMKACTLPFYNLREFFKNIKKLRHSSGKVYWKGSILTHK